MYFKSNDSLIITTPANELNDFLKQKTTDSIRRSSMFRDSTYILTNDYDRFILSKEAKPFERNGILEIHAYLTVREIDKSHSELVSTLRYSDLTYLVIVVLYSIAILFTLLKSNVSFHQDSLLIALVLKFLLVLLELLVINFFLWYGIWSSKEPFKAIISELVDPLKNETTND